MERDGNAGSVVLFTSPQPSSRASGPVFWGLLGRIRQSHQIESKLATSGQYWRFSRMLENLSQQIQDCHRHAERARRNAGAARSATERDDFLEIERSWLRLARSYEVTAQAATFTKESERRVADLKDGAGEYRLYIYDAAGTLVAPATPFQANNDVDAIALAGSMRGLYSADLRDGGRFIKHFPAAA